MATRIINGLTRKQYNISQKNHNKRWIEISGSKSGIPGMVLHHKDITMKKNNPERYILWLPEDLQLMTKSDHVKLHRTGSKHTAATKRKMRQAKLGVPKTAIQRIRMSESHRRYWALRKAREALTA